MRSNKSIISCQLIILNSILFALLVSCSVQKEIAKSAKTDVLDDKALQTAHVGISIFEPATNKYWFNYQGDKYFVPASNTKIPTCYAAMKYLGDSLVGLRYGYSVKDSSVLGIQPAGDPTFLHPDFARQPVMDFLIAARKRYKETTAIMDTIWKEERWGSGWSWNDFDAPYMAERSVMPIFGNIIDIKLNEPEKRGIKDTVSPHLDRVNLFKTQIYLFDSMINKGTAFLDLKEKLSKQPSVHIKRGISSNHFWVEQAERKFTNILMPFVASSPVGYWRTENEITYHILSDSLGLSFGRLFPKSNTTYRWDRVDSHSETVEIRQWNKIHSQPTDSLLKPMMHRSDNFFAEQSLLMVSNEKLGVMNDAKVIDTLLKTDFKDLPQKPRWADGSGLSRYNLFTPQDFVAILNKMKTEFGMERIKVILPTGGEGTISSYYKTDSGYIYGKTGTLSGVVAFSGYLYTKKGKLLIFSTLVNNHQASATDVRRSIEKFLQGIRNKY